MYRFCSRRQPKAPPCHNVSNTCTELTQFRYSLLQNRHRTSGGIGYVRSPRRSSRRGCHPLPLILVHSLASCCKQVLPDGVVKYFAHAKCMCASRPIRTPLVIQIVADSKCACAYSGVASTLNLAELQLLKTEEKPSLLPNSPTECNRPLFFLDIKRINGETTVWSEEIKHSKDPIVSKSFTQTKKRIALCSKMD